jgi:bifunctional non-homologous end joining protein LigD
MSIERYNEKRDFKDTPEPPGKTRATAKTGALRFVVQKHEASHLHYDFRLELNGVLLSWAVPKGPSLNPDDKRLAMHVEDHPLDYRTFEGIIPAGNYGAGTVMVWDEGTYAADPALGKAAHVKQLTEDYLKGKLSFVMHGSKLKGAFSLVRMRGRNGDEDKSWLLIKSDDEYANREDDVRDQDRSASSGRTMAEIAGNKAAKVWNSPKKAAVKGKAKGKAKVAAKAAAPKPRPAARGRKARGMAKAALALGGKLAKVPDIASPQLATLVDAPFDKDGWIFEIKWDGYRALGYFPPHKGTTLLSRNQLSFDAKFAAIRDALDSLPCPAIVDGEIVAMDKQGRASFGRLQQHVEDPADLVYCLFDLLYVDGVDVRDVPLLGRKELLKRLLQNCDPRLQYSDHVATHGLDFFEVARKNALEGIIAKDGAATYHARRTRHWLKIKLEKRQEFIIAGYTAPRRSRSDIGSLVLAYYERAKGKPTGRLRFAGHVGTGMDEATRALLKRKLDMRARKTSPFAVAPPTNEPATWAKPELVCEVRFTEKTADCQLRHPVFIALRDDKAAREIFWDVAEPAQVAVDAALREDRKEQGKTRAGTTGRKAAARKQAAPSKATRARVPPAGRGKADDKYFGGEAPARAGTTLSIGGWDVPVSHPGRIYFPELKLTKLDVIDYYRSIAPLLLPYLKDRPFVLHRFPRGIVAEGFYQKDNPQDLPEWIETTQIHSESTDEDSRYVICQNEATLVYLVNLGCIELHPWSSRVKTLDKPDWMIFDLDPVDVGFAKVVEVAQVLHQIFSGAKVPHYCKTSGKRGLHVAVPLGARYDNNTVREMAHMIAQLVHEELPATTSLERSPSKRLNKIYIDYLQNGLGKTLAAPYSLRPVDYAGVSTPLAWDEVKPKLDPRKFTLHSIRARVKEVGDLWAGVLTEAIDLRKLVKGVK